MSTVDSFSAKQELSVGGTDYEIYALDAVEGAEKLPYSLKILLENLLRTEDGANITEEHVRAWPAGTRRRIRRSRSSSPRRA